MLQNLKVLCLSVQRGDASDSFVPFIICRGLLSMFRHLFAQLSNRFVFAGQGALLGLGLLVHIFGVNLLAGLAILRARNIINHQLSQFLILNGI